MGTAGTATGTATSRPSARARVLNVAGSLFARHGVRGTSLTMIAEQLGVTKAAVYHQFARKDDIVLGVIEPIMAALERLAGDAGAATDPVDRRAIALHELVRIAVANRELAAVLSRDPALGELLVGHARFQAAIRGLERVLIGDRPTVAMRVALAVAGQGIMAAGSDPTLAELDDAALCRHLEAACKRLLEVSN